MKRLILNIFMAALIPLSIIAQDARQRTTATIVADALAQLPISSTKTYNRVMDELAQTGADGILELSSMLVPADKGKNATVEYALNGVVSYASGMPELTPGVRKGLAQALRKCTDDPNRAFLMTLLQSCANAEDIPVFLSYVDDPYLNEWAINGLAAIDGSDQAILDLMKKGDKRAQLAYIAGVKKLDAAEPILIEWLDGADAPTATAIYKALAQCGSLKSLDILAKAAAADKYAWPGTFATESYLVLLNRLAENNADSKTVTNYAKKLLGATDRNNVRAGALNAIYKLQGVDAMPYLEKALKDNDRKYRVSALRQAEMFANDNVYASVANKLNGKTAKEVKADIINWIGENGANSQVDAVVACIANPDPEVAQAAIKAAGILGGDKALAALVGQLNGENAAYANAALLRFNGKVNNAVIDALNADDKTKVQALNIIGKRHMTEATNKVFDNLNDPNKDVKEAAHNALIGVASQKDFNRIAALIEKASPEWVPQLQSALKKSIASLDKDKQYAIVKPIEQKSAQPWLYYPVLAQSGTKEAIAEIMKGYNGKNREEAFKSLLNVNNTDVIDVLYSISIKDKANSSAALNRYNQLVAASNYTDVRKYQLYRNALEVTKDSEVQNRLLNSLAKTMTYPSLLLAQSYISNPATATRAAYAVRNIASKNTEAFGGKPVENALNEALKHLKTLDDADAGYAADDIRNILSQLPTNEYKPLSAIDPNKNYENFELLFQWKGTGKLGVRSQPSLALGGNNSGALFSNLKSNNSPASIANNAEGEWNNAYVKVNNDRVTAIINGVTTVPNLILENSNNRALPIDALGKISLAGDDDQFAYREIYIRELPASISNDLSEEEKNDGFDLLFDGRSMHKWTGNTTDYVPVDGTIYVTAQYGGSGNLYTVNEYSDFVLRFEFCFLREGVNNGVGIRTPMGVDAAYEGMEIQILDHDAPIYRGLREYQVHGSVYGIIPAKRVKFPEIGTWHTEEIRAIGDHITVTVNGEVILDGNIREACQGNNMAPAGEKKNPFTVDGKSHPGLFNKSGHIGFLGHGAGIQFRNIRVKDLSSTKKSKKLK